MPNKYRTEEIEQEAEDLILEVKKLFTAHKEVYKSLSNALTEIRDLLTEEEHGI
jgi:DNA anti-recombination protein RmuC